MTTKDLNPNEYLPYFKSYINYAENIELIEGLDIGLNQAIAFYKTIPESKLNYSYATGKWTIKEIISHLIDSERVFGYRALRFARQDKTPVAGFNENDYAITSNANNRSFKDLIEEFSTLRKSTITLFKGFTKDMLLNKGIAGSGEVSVRALGFLIIGHEKHHFNVIKERYL